MQNAAHALAGRPEAELTVAVKPGPSGVAITVTDNGPGIPRDVRRKIFDPSLHDQGARHRPRPITKSTSRRTAAACACAPRRAAHDVRDPAAASLVSASRRREVDGGAEKSRHGTARAASSSDMSDGTDDRGSSARFDAGELLRHATWLRALARALVRPDEVDDVVQETWAAALSRPPGSAAALRTWLERVVRNIAFQFARRSDRRARREQAAALPESQPATADVVARAALHRELVGRVLALDEPTRSVVLLRFFDGRAADREARGRERGGGAGRG